MNMNPLQVYHDLVQEVLDTGERRIDRTGTGTLCLFGKHISIPLHRDFPLLTSKKVHFRSIVHELLWFLKGESNIQYLKNNKVSIWDEWAQKNGELGPVYGVQWRSWPMPDGSSRDQISELVSGLQSNPFSRRHIVNAWNVSCIDQMALPPCHILFQFFVSNTGGLSCQVYQRSADLFLGVPFNIASYALLTHMIAQVCQLKADTLSFCFGDTHLYLNHLQQSRELLSRAFRPLPQLKLNREIIDLDAFRFEDIEIAGYNPHPALYAPISV